ncbi:hypothetical protein Csa_003929 [Cucumis sativus]|uniref:Uncharacterized protein n=1 Tax=Cucumis sativus TaxID=3659 RepID=A0A0A0KJV0_CUCSA|nr:hypothetical protein Csa_003929 [Cucumis sativus]
MENRGKWEKEEEEEEKYVYNVKIATKERAKEAAAVCMPCGIRIIDKLLKWQVVGRNEYEMERIDRETEGGKWVEESERKGGRRGPVDKWATSDSGSGGNNGRHFGLAGSQ